MDDFWLDRLLAYRPILSTLLFYHPTQKKNETKIFTIQGSHTKKRDETSWERGRWGGDEPE